MNNSETHQKINEAQQNEFDQLIKDYMSKWKFIGGCVGQSFKLKTKKPAIQQQPEFMYRATKNYILGQQSDHFLIQKLFKVKGNQDIKEELRKDQLDEIFSLQLK